MDPTPTLKATARLKLIEYATMQARTGLQMIRNSIETDPRMTEESYSTLLANLHAMEDAIASAQSGPPSTPSESATSPAPAA